MRFITEREARALREDAASAIGNVAVKRLPGERRLTSAHRVRIRIGDPPVRNAMTMPRAEFYRALDNHAVYRKRKPICRACGSRIEHSEKAVEFQIWGSGWHPVTAFIHETCPTDHVFEPIEGTTVIGMDRETHRRLHAGDPHRR